MFATKKKIIIVEVGEENEKKMSQSSVTKDLSNCV